MSNNPDSQIIPASPSSGNALNGVWITPSGGQPVQANNAPAPAHIDIFGTLHRVLRGRYLWVLIVGLIIAGAGTWGGWKFGQPVYRSEGLVRIAYVLPRVMSATDQNEPMAMFETFMQSQKLLISSRRVIDMALQDPIWRTGHRMPPDPQLLATHLQVNIKPRSEYIQVSVTDTDAAVAAAAVTSIINAYSELYNSQDRQLERQRIGVLEEKQKNQQDKIAGLQDKVRAISLEYGTGKLDVLSDAAIARVTKLEMAVSDIRTAMATAPPEEAPAVPNLAVGPATREGGPLSFEQIASVDQTMRGYLGDQARIEDSIEQMTFRGLGPKHTQMLAARHDLEKLKERMTKYADLFRTFRAATAQNIGDPVGVRVDTGGKSLQTLRKNEAALVKLHGEAKQEMMTIGTKQIEMDRLEGEIKTNSDELSMLNKRIESLRTESSLGGRLSIVSTGEIPLNPDKDPRIKMAGIGAAGAMGVWVGLIFLIGLISRRYRYSDETEAEVASRIPLLGILPHISNTSPDGEQMLMAARCIHQVRVALSNQRDGGHAVYLISSGAAGEGKTSLTMALGLSFAAARVKTLVVDCDWVGRGLTRKLRATEQTGLFEALGEGGLNGHVQKTIAGLNVLAAGQVDVSHAYTLSAEALKPILEQARREYQVVLIDTGPILGSVEASVLAQQVDGTIFTIARGQDRESVERSLNFLHSQNARVIGFVFNQAKMRDFMKSGYGSTTRSSTEHQKATVSRAARIVGLYDEMGPLVQAVASQLPGSEDAGETLNAAG